TDPDEPVHHLHKYALYALAPYVVYGLAREVGYYVVHVPFWSTWYSFGNRLTGQPVNQYPSLISGTILHSLQGYVLALGFYLIDQTAFARAKMELQNGPTLIEQKQEARYRFILRFGPRSYNDYTGLVRDLDAGPITVTGHLLRHGTIVAWCSAYIPSLESPNAITKPAAYFPAVRNMNYSDFPADCLGPRSATTAPQKDDT